MGSIGTSTSDDVDVLKSLADDEGTTISLGLDPVSGGSRSSSVDADTGTNGSSSNAGTTLRIKSGHGDTAIEIPNKGCPKTTSVFQLKALVRKALLKKEAEKGCFSNSNDDDGHGGDRYLRLICKGRLLSPDGSFLSEFKIADNDVVHAVLAPGAARKESNTTTNTGSGTNPAAQRRETAATEHNNNNNNLRPLFLQQRRRRQRPNRGIGTIVGPGGRVTRAPNSGNSDANSSDDDSDNDDNDEAAGRRSSRTRRGFDRLRNAGLSRQEITAMRTYFNRHVDRFVQQQQQQQQQQSFDLESGGSSSSESPSPPSALHLDEPDLRRRRLLVEEEWMVTQGPASEFRLNLDQNTLMSFASIASPSSTGGTGGGGRRAAGRPGTDRDFIWGFCLGFFVGPISLIWVWMPTIPHKQKLGLLAGMSFQVVLENKQDNNNIGGNDHINEDPYAFDGN